VERKKSIILILYNTNSTSWTQLIQSCNYYIVKYLRFIFLYSFYQKLLLKIWYRQWHTIDSATLVRILDAMPTGLENSRGKSARIFLTNRREPRAESRGRIRAASISKYSDNLGIRYNLLTVDRARRWIYRVAFPRHENSRERETVFARRQSSRRARRKKEWEYADMCEKHGALDGVGVDVVRYYVEA